MEDYAKQFSIPYIQDKNGTTSYTLYTDGDWTQYKSHVNGKNVLEAGTLKKGEWQNVSTDIDMKTDTFRVSVDGEYLLAGVNASYFNNVFYDGKKQGFVFSGGTSFSYYNNAYYGTNAPNKDSNPIILVEDPFEGSAPLMDRQGTVAANITLLNSNHSMPNKQLMIIPQANTNRTIYTQSSSCLITNINFTKGNVSNNSSRDGGGIFVGNNTKLTLNSGNIQNNTATGAGSGICILENATAVLASGTISGNTADGGGIQFLYVVYNISGEDVNFHSQNNV